MESKVILLAGGSSAIGQKIGQDLKSQGHKVYIGYNSSKQPQGIALNVLQDSQCKSAIEGIVRRDGRLDVLIYCVGVSKSGVTTEFTSEDFKHLLDINVVGFFRLVKYAKSHLLKTKGTIISITSLNSYLAYPNFGLYSATKHALAALGTSLQYENPKLKIVNLAPGAVITNSVPTKMAHRSLRETVPFVRWLIPMATSGTVSKIISQIVTRPHDFSSQVIIGSDARIVYLLKKVLPLEWFDLIITKIWQKQSNPQSQ